MAARLDPTELGPSLMGMESFFEKAGLNREAKLGFIRNAVMEHMDLVQLAFYRSPTTLNGINKKL